jgi:hypothetical protein
VGRHIADGCPTDVQPKRHVADRGVFYGCIAEGVWPNIAADKSADRSVLTERGN